jgi:archaellum component FlaC
MQKDAPQAPQASTPPPSPANAANPVFVFQGPQGTGPITLQAPRSARDIDALKARREELSNQLQSVDSRRSKLLTQLQRTNDATAVKGLEARLSLLDARQLQLESDIATTGQQLSSASAGLIGTTGQPVFYGGMSSKQVMALSVLSIIFVLFPLATGLSRAIWKRSAKAAVPPAVLTETAQRLERLESSVDAIAIEIERISEGQRFVTKLLSDGQAAPMLGVGQRAAETV